MDDVSNTQRTHEPKPVPDNGLPEAHDKTTEQIHNMSDFSVSESLGVPLLTKDIGKTDTVKQGREEARRAGFDDQRGFADRRASFFDHFDSRDRAMAAVSAVMVLGPLFFGMMRG